MGQTQIDYRHELLAQFLLISSVMGAFSINGVVGLIGHVQKGRVHSWIFYILNLASLVFVTATVMIACLIPVTHALRAEGPSSSIHRVMQTSDVAIWAVIIGLVLLLAALGILGFTRSRRAGALTMASAVCALGALLWMAVNLQDTVL